MNLGSVKHLLHPKATKLQVALIHIYATLTPCSKTNSNDPPNAIARAG